MKKFEGKLRCHSFLQFTNTEEKRLNVASLRIFDSEFPLFLKVGKP